MTVLATLKGLHDRLVSELDPEEEALRVEIIRPFPWARLGLKRDGIVLLLPEDRSSGAIEHELQHIRISSSSRFIVRDSDGEHEEAAAVVSTKSLDPWLVNSFLELLAMLLEAGTEGNPESVRKLIDNLVSLFRTLTQPAQKSVQGLWGELLLISQSSDVPSAVRAWHATPGDRYDFSIGHERVEVKTTTGPRVHTFSHTQLVPVEGVRITVASLILTPNSDGVSCSDLSNAILLDLDDVGLKQKFVNQVVRTLGSDWQNQSGARFRVDQAVEDLRFFDANSVPRITNPIPANVFAVKYQSDLQVAVSLSLGDLDENDLLTRNLAGG
jgi:hypothetical protein